MPTERMLDPSLATDKFSQRFSATSSMAQAFAEVNRPTRDTDIGDDDVTYNDVHRQLMLILKLRHHYCRRRCDALGLGEVVEHSGQTIP